MLHAIWSPGKAATTQFIGRSGLEHSAIFVPRIATFDEIGTANLTGAPI